MVAHVCNPNTHDHKSKANMGYSEVKANMAHIARDPVRKITKTQTP
jgi:hypothetical protein